MSIVYLFVSVLLLYQSVIKIDVPNKWASACVQPAIDDGRWQYWLNNNPISPLLFEERNQSKRKQSNLQSKNIYKIKKKKKKKNLAAKKSGGTTDRVTADQRYNGARYSEAWLYVAKLIK